MPHPPSIRNQKSRISPERAYRYRVELFGSLCLREAAPNGRVITRFRTQKTAALLAYLAFHRDRLHSREVLMEAFWPGVTNGRMSLAVALSSLRAQLEPPGVPPHSVLLSDRTHVGLNPDAVTTDSARFEELLDFALAGGAAGPEKIAALGEAVDMYRPQLLSGQYEGWIVPQQERLADRFRAAARALANVHEEAGRIEDAVAMARRAQQSEPECPELCAELLRLLVQAGDPQAAVHEYTQMRERLCALAGGEEVLLPEEVTSVVEPFLVASPVPARRPLAPAPAGPGVQVVASPVTKAPVVPQAALAAPAVTPVLAPLPSPLTRFFGRDAELPRLRRLIDDPANRLVTVTGPGGIGKTRIALAFAESLRSGGTGGRGNRVDDDSDDVSPLSLGLLDAFEDAGTLGAEVPTVFWVSLAHLTEPSLVAATLAEAVGAETRGTNAQTPDALLNAAAATLARAARPVLVVDSVEHVVEEAAASLEHLLYRVPGLSCVATSRQRLAVPGEREFPLGALPTPPLSSRADTVATADALTPRSGDDPDPEDLLRWYPSVALFVDRAQHARADFQINPRNAGPVGELVARLEGIPLAIELAAARAQVLSPSQMLAQLFPPDAASGPAARFEMLTNKGRGRVTLERHRSLRATLAWSYDLLAPELRHLFSRLGVFRGTFDAGDVDAVLSAARSGPAGGRHRMDVLDALAELCDASLIRPVEEVPSSDPGSEEAPQVRFTMLETLRAFAEDRLETEASCEEIHRLRASHAAHYLSLVERMVAENKATPAREAARYDRLDLDRENVRAALNFAASGAARGDEEMEDTLLRLVAGLGRFWRLRGRMTEGRRWTEIAGASCRCDHSSATADRLRLEATVLSAGGTLAIAQGDSDAAMGLFTRTLHLCESLEDQKGVAGTLSNLAILAKERGEAELARTYCERALQVYRELGNERLAGSVLSILAALALSRQDGVTAEKLCRESLEIAERVGDVISLGTRLGNLSEAYFYQGRYAEAERTGRESLQAALQTKDAVGASLMLANLARLDSLRGERRRAERLLLAALAELAARQCRLYPSWRDTIVSVRPDVWPETATDVTATSLLEALRLLLSQDSPDQAPPVPLTLHEAAAYAQNHFDTAPNAPGLFD